jgi:hypothetical protein
MGYTLSCRRVVKIATSMPSPIITHPINKWSYLLWCTGTELCDEDSMQATLGFVKNIFKQNGYNDWQICRALNHHLHLDLEDNKPNSIAFMPFVGTIFNRISRVLAQHNIKSLGLPHVKLFSLLHPVKDSVRLRIPGQSFSTICYPSMERLINSDTQL